MKRTILATGILSLSFFSCNSQAEDKALDKIPVTYGTSATFNWVDWKKAPQRFKDATRLIQTGSPTATTLYDFIQTVLNDEYDPEAKVDIALIDLNNDGVLGIGIWLSSGTWCGTAGCTYEFYDNGGMLEVGLSDYDLKPMPNGLRSTANKFFGLKANPRSRYKTLADVPAIFKQSQ